MKKEELEFVSGIIERASWLFYGDWENSFDLFLKKVFEHDFKEYGFDKIEMTDDFRVAYWQLLSELSRLNLVDYGSSPRGAWLTEEGKRFREIVLKHPNPIGDAQEYIYRKYNA